MMHGRGKSDEAIVAGKPANQTGRPAAEPVERGAEAEGNGGQQSTFRTQSRESASHALDRIRHFAVRHPRWEPYAGKPLVRFCAGGAR